MGPNLRWSFMSPLVHYILSINVHGNLQFAATWDYISQLSTTKQAPIRSYYVTAGDITHSSLRRSWRGESAGKGGGGRERAGAHGLCTAGRSSCTLSSLLLPQGGINLFQNSHTRGGVLLNKGVLTRLEDDDRVVGPAVRDRKEARWQCMFSNACAGPGARANQQVV